MASSTIPEALQSLREKIASAYEACEARDAELPTIQNTANLAQAVSTIPTDYTVFDFGDGDLSSFNWQDKITYQNMVDAGLLDEVEQTWTKMPVNVMVGSSVTSIGNGAFDSCTSLTSVVIPDSVTSVGMNAFSYSGLTSVMIPDSVTSIVDDAFEFCSGLTSVTIPDNVTSIGDDAFYGCTSLIYVVLPTKTIAQVQAMNYIDWGLTTGCKICCSDGVIDIA